MNTFRVSWLIFLAAVANPNLIAADTRPNEAASPPDRGRVEKLIRQLGDDSFSERQRAVQELDAIGEPALSMLVAAVGDADLDISTSAKGLIERISMRRTMRLALTPSKVHLYLKNATVSEAAAELARQSGCPVTIGDFQTSTSARITLDTGETNFWDALDQLCRKAKIVEQVPILLPFGYGGQFDVGAQAIDLQDQSRKLSSGGIRLIEGTLAELPTADLGAVRIRVVPTEAVGSSLKATPGGDLAIVLDVAAEAGLHNFHVTGPPRIDKAVDNEKQMLRTDVAATAWNEGVTDENIIVGRGGRRIAVRGGWGRAGRNVGVEVNANSLGRMTVPIYLQQGDISSSRLSELSGTIPVETLLVEPVATVDGILKSAGQKFAGFKGGEVEVKSVEELTNGAVRIKLVLTDLPAQEPRIDANQVFGRRRGFVRVRNEITIERSRDQMPQLVDARGRLCELVDVRDQLTEMNGATLTETFTLTYQRQQVEAEPVRLVVEGRRRVAFDLPFTLKDVPLK